MWGACGRKMSVWEMQDHISNPFPGKDTPHVPNQNILQFKRVFKTILFLAVLRRQPLQPERCFKKETRKSGLKVLKEKITIVSTGAGGGYSAWGFIVIVVAGLFFVFPEQAVVKWDYRNRIGIQPTFLHDNYTIRGEALRSHRPSFKVEGLDSPVANNL